MKEGGSGDPNNNSRLATVIAKAKAANMPNDNIKRTIDKALGAGSTDNFEKVVYEGYGPSAGEPLPQVSDQRRAYYVLCGKVPRVNGRQAQSLGI